MGGVTPSYDANGNLTYDGVWSYTYDRENRLVGAWTGQESISYRYDAFNRLVERQAGLEVRRFYYDDQWRLVVEYDGSGNLVARYVYGPGIDEPVRMSRNGTNYYYHAAALGTVMEITDEAGAVVEQYTYGVYGEVQVWDGGGGRIGSSQIGNRLLFQGRDRDPDTGLYNFRNRYYSPAWGRFVQVDPIREYGGLNFYLFASNSPQDQVDWYGLAASPNDCEVACTAARSDPSINDGIRLGIVMCTGTGVKCPCLLGYKQYGFNIGDCPEIDKVILAHERGHINTGCSQCDPSNKNPHPARCCHSEAAHRQEECDLKKKDIDALREAARLSKGACKGHADAIRASVELWYKSYCK